MSPVLSELGLSDLPKLNFNGGNYHLWWAVWKRVFQLFGVAHVIERHYRPPRQGDLSKWQKDDDEAFLLLLTSIRPRLASVMYTYNTSAEAWAALKLRFDRVNRKI